LIRELNGSNPKILPGYRLKVLRETKAGALPGKSLVVFVAELGISTDVIPCEDSHAQERFLL